MKRQEIKCLLLSWVSWRKIILIWSRQDWLRPPLSILTHMFSCRRGSFSFMRDLEIARGNVFTWGVICWVTGQMVDHVSVAERRCNLIGFFLHHVKKYTVLRNTQHHLFWKMDNPILVNELKEWHQEFNGGLLEDEEMWQKSFIYESHRTNGEWKAVVIGLGVWNTLATAKLHW